MAELSKRSAEYEGLVKDLEQEVSSGQIQITQLREGLRLNLAQDILFRSGSATLEPYGVELLTKVSEQLAKFPQQVEVQGHTDNVPVSKSSRWGTNWELAAARAASVVRLFEKHGVDPKHLRAVSYGEHAPVDSNDTAEGRARNRRIDIRLKPIDAREEAAAAGQTRRAPVRRRHPRRRRDRARRARGARGGVSRGARGGRARARAARGAARDRRTELEIAGRAVPDGARVFVLAIGKAGGALAAAAEAIARRADRGGPRARARWRRARARALRAARRRAPDPRRARRRGHARDPRVRGAARARRRAARAALGRRIEPAVRARARASRSPTSRRPCARCSRRGASIDELNTVRKHLAAATGGRLARAARARAGSRCSRSRTWWAIAST